MSVLLANTHKGNVFENLADFLLSALGIANPARRQFDVGFDFYCFLSEPLDKNAELLRFDRPYSIQIKSSSDRDVVYGKGYEKWKSEDVQWLFRHQSPFFIGFLNTETYTLDIFDTTGLWYLYAQDKLQCSQVVFKPNNIPTDFIHTPIHPTITMIGETKTGAGQLRPAQFKTASGQEVTISANADRQIRNLKVSTKTAAYKLTRMDFFTGTFKRWEL